MSAAPVIVIGSGLAGLMTALSLAPLPVLLLTKAGLGQSASSPLAQGGIAASVGPDDNAALHLSDTLAAGDGLCDVAVVSAVVSEAPAAIAQLEKLGVVFDRNADGTLALGLEAAHSRNRIVHAGGDASGAVVVRALVEAVLRTPSITVMEGAVAERLLMDGARVIGVECQSGAVFTGRAVVLASGGLGGLYDATTNPMGNVGQGIALAARAGAQLADMEFVQFHPTALDVVQAPLPLISEAVRGEGAILVNARGQRFMDGVPGKELAARDIVARAIAAQIADGGQVFLDARQVLGARFSTRFPAIHAICARYAIRPESDLIPVRPAVHYHMGGVASDDVGRTSVDGLWAVGEVASTGLHGANRLASNSLLEAVVMAMRAAKAISAGAVMPIRPVAQCTDRASQSENHRDIDMVRATVSQHLGVLRKHDGLLSAIHDLAPLVETDDAAAVALVIAVAAYQRTESRGAHARSDYPHKHASAARSLMTLADAIQFSRDILHPRLLHRSA